MAHVRRLLDFPVTGESFAVTELHRRAAEGWMTVDVRWHAETALVKMADAIALYGEMVVLADGERDYVLGDFLGQMLSAFRGLLSGPRGRLHAGTCDRWCMEVAQAIGYDLDLHRMT
jgi:hypothetical protein